MNQQTNILRVSQLLSRLSEQVKILNKNGDFSTNIYSENLFERVLSVLFDCELENVNYSENHTYPSVDLRDKKKRIAFQITSTPSYQKMKDTIEKFISHDLYKDYDQLYVFIIKSKLDDYKQEKLDEYTQGIFSFEKSQILDKSDLLSILLQKNDSDLTESVKNILESELADIKDGSKWSDYFEGLPKYDDYINKLFQDIEIKGFSPKVSSTQVSIKLDEIYVEQTLSTINNLNIINSTKPANLDQNIKLPSIETIFNNYRNVILGDPGAGKSTLLKYLARKVCGTRNTDTPIDVTCIPVLIKASDYGKFLNKEQKSLDEFIIDHFEKKFENIFAKGLNNQTLLVLFDGIDEINDIKLRHEVTEQINKFIALYSDIRFVITSRKVGYHDTQLGGDFHHYEIDEFNKRQIELFINSWYASITPNSDNLGDGIQEEAKLLYNSIESNESVVRLARNPLLMTIIALIDHQGSSLPERRVELYEISTSTFLENWVKRRKSTTSITFDKHSIVEVLSPIAFHMHEYCKDDLIGEKEFRNKLIDEYSKIYLSGRETVIKNVNGLIDFLRQDAGFIFEKGRDDFGNGQFGFVHLTFQEYFAAISFKSKWKEGKLTNSLDKYLFNSNWYEVMLLTCSLFRQNEQSMSSRKEATKFIQEILDTPDKFPELKRPLDFVFDALKDEVHIEQSKFIEVFNEVLTILSLKDNNNLNYHLKSKFSFKITKLLRSKIYKDYIVEQLTELYEKSSNLTLKNNIVDIFSKSFYIESVRKFIDDKIQSNDKVLINALYNDELFPIVISDENKSEIYVNGFANYINDNDVSGRPLLALNYILNFISFADINNTDSETVIKNIVKALKKLDDDKSREYILIPILGFWQQSPEYLSLLNEEIEREFPSLELSQFDMYMNYVSKSKNLKERVFNYGDLSFYILESSSNEIAVENHSNELYGPNSIEFFNFEDTNRLKSIIESAGQSFDENIETIIKKIIQAYNSDSKIIEIESSKLLTVLTKSPFSFYFKTNLSFYKINLLFFNSAETNQLTNSLASSIGNQIPIDKKAIEDFGIDRLIKSVKESSISEKNKLILLYRIGESESYEPYVDKCIDIYRKSDNQQEKDGLISALKMVL